MTMFDTLDYEKITQAMEKFVKEQTPDPGNKCACGGQVVCMVRSLFRGRFGYEQPRCENCGRVYILANAPKRGEKEFMEILRRPFTI